MAKRADRQETIMELPDRTASTLDELLPKLDSVVSELSKFEGWTQYL
jgi:hypothetical protein